MDVPEIPPIPVICGPTASGKTSAAGLLAQSYPIEVISADSRQMIRCLDVGTAKPTQAERQKIRFHLIDIIEPGERYTAFQFIEDAEEAIAQTLARSRIPIVVGGTGLYLRALIDGIVEIADDDLQVRQRLENEMHTLGPEAMYERLSEIDPVEAAKLHPNNRVRVIRALEIYYVAGRPKTELAEMGATRRSVHHFSCFCLVPERQQLYRAADRRVDLMLKQGFVHEVRRLVENGLSNQLRRANVIGYNEMLDHLDGRLSLDEAVCLIKQNTRRYAKRQITWLRHQLSSAPVFRDPDGLVAAVRLALEEWRSRVEKA